MNKLSELLHLPLVIIPNITREGKGGKTDLGIFPNKKFPKAGYVNLIPYGKQKITLVKCMVIQKKIPLECEYVSLTLYKQRNGEYKLKVKPTEVIKEEEGTI